MARINPKRMAKRNAQANAARDKYDQLNYATDEHRHLLYQGTFQAIVLFAKEDPEGKRGDEWLLKLGFSTRDRHNPNLVHHGHMWHRVPLSMTNKFEELLFALDPDLANTDEELEINPIRYMGTLLEITLDYGTSETSGDKLYVQRVSAIRSPGQQRQQQRQQQRRPSQQDMASQLGVDPDELPF